MRWGVLWLAWLVALPRPEAAAAAEAAGPPDVGTTFHAEFPAILTQPERARGLVNTSDFQRWLWAKQNPPSCANVQFLAFVDPKWAWFQGLGHLVFLHAKLLIFGVGIGRLLVFRSSRGFPWTDPSVCRDQSLGCFFLPLSNCTAYAAARNTRFIDMDGMLKAKKAMHYAHVSSPWLMQFGSDWLEHQMVGYIVRPQPFLQAATLRYHRQLFPNGTVPRPLAHVHVRYGDLLEYGSQHYISLENYVRCIDALGLGARHVYVSTETDWVIPRLQRDYPNFTWHHTDVQRVVVRGKVMTQVVKRLGAGNSTLEHLSNLFLTLAADGYVGLSLSRWCRLLHMLHRFWRPRSVLLWANAFVAEHNLTQTMPADLRRPKATVQQQLKKHAPARK